MQHASPQLNRERERDSREREIIERQRQEEMAHRERERERDHREQIERQLERRDQPHHPVQSHTGSIPLHQPVANKVPNSIHGPGGLLSTLGGNPQNGHQGGPQSAAGLFGPQMPHGEGTPRSYMQHPGGPSGQPMMGYNASGQQIPGNVAALAQGQQPILNDALSYLDQVKVRFVDQPDVYNRFLDIMKDFKSQAIDTPGVIQRVSTLFNGHPALIQGFNTFLPPGYRIECGTEDNPDAIRVTTPSGTNTLSMPRAGRPFETISNVPPTSDPHARSDFYRDQSRTGWQQSQQQDQQQGSASGSYSPGSRMMAGMYGQDGAGSAQDHHYGYPTAQEQQVASAMTHQQDHRGVAQLQGAASAASAGLGRASLLGVSGAGQNASLTQPMNSLAGVGTGMLQGAQDLNKRGPVEFNHAISYVNKIKNRFSSAPEIYKQFLEILQTYQRESKPIQDVYGQVTQLFNTAPDLLEDFKQFLPESAAHAKQVAAQRQAEEQAPLSNLRGEPAGFASQTPNRDVKMPPLGQFNVKDPKENKKRRGGPGGVGSISGPAGSEAARLSEAGRGGQGQFGNTSKRPKYHHGKPSIDMANVSPTLIPALPEPLPPSVSMTPSQEEIAFFDRVKKFIANKQVFSDFLKLCNLYTTDLLDRHVLVKRAEGYIGSNAELMSWFRRFMSAEEPEDKTIDPKTHMEYGVVNLAHCRSLGPSYRLLPKRERTKPCSGRDPLCNSVLNDDWASHPTWASEDSGFVAHRKNQYEDALHRIEEDRHDYDHHIEACVRTIQLVEPICQQFLHMSDSERNGFQLPTGLGGQSEAIYQRVIKKIYDRQRGEKVIQDMFSRPCHVLPIVLFRLKQKLEEWKACQREWDKVWREQMQRAYWRSLDHQAIATKQTDKKLFVAKNIQQDLQNKFEDGLNHRKSGWPMPKWQAEFEFSDMEVLLDAVFLLILYFDRSTNGFGAEPQRLINFVKDFIPTFFGLDRETFHQYIDEVSIAINDDEDAYANEDASNGSRKVVDTQKLDLLRETLDRGYQSEKPAKEDGIPNQDEAPVVRATSTVSDTEESFDVAELRWMEHPGQGNFNLEHEYTLNEKYKKKEHHMYSNLNIFCFLRTFEILYSRLLRIKENEAEAREQVRRGLVPKPAHDLCLIDRFPSDFFYDVEPKANLYKQIVRMCEEVIKGDIDQIHLEETLRRFYMQSGFLLYNLERIFSSIAKFVASIFTGDSRDRSSDIANLFFKEREKEETTHHQEIQYRKQVERLVKDGDIYRITFVSSLTTIQHFLN
jgi:paired amphipathic helix protein Sin3a